MVLKPPVTSKGQDVSTTLLLGDLTEPDVHSIVGRLRSIAPPGRIRAAGDVAEARRVFERDGWIPDLIIVLQSWPDQYLPSDVLAIQQAAPLARLVTCFGPWSDSDGRNRAAWPAAARVPVAAAAPRCERELGMLYGDLRSAQRDVFDCHRHKVLPLTASRHEIFEFDFSSPPHRTPKALRVAVESPDRRFREMLVRALGTAGYGNADPGKDPGPDAIIWDADPWDGERQAALSAVRHRNKTSQIIAAVGFPRADLADELRHAGADGTWYKLSPLAQLTELLG
jgi:hypothetical protein